MPPTSKPKVVAIMEACPCGKAQGARIRARGVLDLLAQNCDLSLILASRWSHDEVSIARTQERYNLVGSYKAEPRPLTLRERISHELNPFHLNTHNAVFPEKVRSEVTRHITQADIVWFHSVVPANALGINSLRKAIVDVDDLYSRFHTSAAQKQKGIAGIRAKRLSLLWRRREAVYARRFGTIVVCSEDDKLYLGNPPGVFVLPNGFDEAANAHKPSHTPADQPTIGFVGNLNYAPNRDGLIWFLTNVWPGFKAKHSNCHLHIIGGGGEAVEWSAYPDVKYFGWIENLEIEMSTWAFTVVPIWEGGGTRVKIATAFSMQCPVVATSLGAFGYRLKHRSEILLADTKEAFGESCSELLTNPSLGREIAHNAHRLFLSELTWASMAPRMDEIITYAKANT